MATNKVNVGSTALANNTENRQSLQDRLTAAKREAANKYYTAKSYTEALIRYNELIELCPSAINYANRCACYMMLQRYRDGLSDAKKCIELDPTFLKVYVRIIKCCLILGEITEAHKALSKLEELDPNNKLAAAEKKELEYVQKYLTDANAAYAAKDFRKVVYCMDRCCDISKSSTKFKLKKAECLAFLGRYQEAQEIANDILHINMRDVEAIYIRGMCLYFQDITGRAFAHFRQVLRLAPGHSQTVQIYNRAKNLKKKKEEGNVAFKMEQYQKAYDLYTDALTIDPQNVMTNAKLHYNKATAAAKLGRLQEAVTECTEALNLDENYLKALLRRASSYMDLKEFEKAVRDLEKACKLDKSRDNKRLLLEAQAALKKSKKKDYYQILGIDKNASTDDIKKAYRKRAMVHHPDRHATATEGEKKEQEKKFKEVGEAYGILSDPKKRSRYDSGHDFEVGDGDSQDFDPTSVFQPFFGPNDGYSGFCANDNFPGSFSFHFGG